MNMLPATEWTVDPSQPLPVLPEGLTDADVRHPETVLASLVKAGQLSTLTFDQKKLLAGMLDFPTLDDAANWAGIPKRRHQYWVRTNQIYREAVNAVGEAVLLEARSRFKTLAVQAQDVFEEGLGQTKRRVQEVTCPCGCDHTFKVALDQPDFSTRLSVARDVFKHTGDLGNVKVTHEGEVKYRNMSMEDNIALATIARGGAVPPDVRANLEQRGLIEPVRSLPLAPQESQISAPSPTRIVDPD